MKKVNPKNVRLLRRKRHIRRSCVGTADRPRLSVYRSLNHIYAQIIDDTAEGGSGRTLVSASSLALKVAGGNKEGAEKVGQALAEKAKAASIRRVRFDRNGRLYHGRLHALAEAARKGGLEF